MLPAIWLPGDLAARRNWLPGDLAARQKMRIFTVSYQLL
jgi:hypothetical protein